MWVWVLWVVVGLLVMALGGFLALVLVMRTKNRRGLLVVRRLGRRFGRPIELRTAGEPGASAAVIRHVGRRSGAPYATPIGVYPLDDGFLVYLPYGPDVDWLRNTRAAGSAELRVEGRTYLVTPQIIEPADALRHVSARDRGVARLFGVTDFLVLRGAPVASGDTGPGDAGAGGTASNGTAAGGTA
ncbi:nitroreductase family deazaflavin-dependent oxidoreductase [Promicromonospora iranensis]|uniref:Deazaflavin-dependent oxidoreductase (Nitroreductase family) n=1 Tax=Promicromonospora iranensis TaxID=1105144 RepID=A0ABU2CN73_9MICO|nr:nitroreductase family deazaflavin-dependent oxidoreductase [Promicromonospora iranensis]MDR7382788.1 deazaflavin-dependent oxidoreductase (nitroreductase family) [Promicromonospora iranensis]